MNAADPAGVSWLRVILAFAVVFGLLGLLSFGLKRVAARGIMLPGGKARRLEVVETLPLDMRRRLVIVRCDSTEHLLLLGTEKDIVVRSQISDVECRKDGS